VGREKAILYSGFARVLFADYGMPGPVFIHDRNRAGLALPADEQGGDDTDMNLLFFFLKDR